ncbi:hypothetical protein FRC08_016030 [Ceratobasidium sp. 394]|nr:hypothetical protein FRC08_016030 [Ceratobasidium sp. 394]
MTTEAMQQMIATLQAGLKDFHNRSLSENQKILQSSQQRELLLDAQAKQLESIQEPAKQALKHAQAEAEGSKEALAKTQEGNQQIPIANQTIKEINDGWCMMDENLHKYVKESHEVQQKRDEGLKKTIKSTNNILINQQDKLRDIEDLVQAIEKQVTSNAF